MSEIQYYIVKASTVNKVIAESKVLALTTDVYFPQSSLSTVTRQGYRIIFTNLSFKVYLIPDIHDRPGSSATL